jgi:hypothetical protein
MITLDRLPPRLPPVQPAPAALRAARPALTPSAFTLSGPAPTHDFLVPNPRPDLAADRHFLRMIEAG